MNRFLLGIGLLGAMAGFAGDPPFPTEVMKGYMLRGFDQFDDVAFTPGTLDCKEYPSSSYTSWTCTLKDTTLTVDTGKNKVTIAFATMNASETAATPSYPGQMTYYMNGKISIPLPDGGKLDDVAALNMTRKSDNPSKVDSRLTAYNINLNSAVFMKWPGAPVVDPAPGK